MLHSLKTLFESRLETPKGSARLRDAFFDGETGHLEYIAIETEGPGPVEALLPADRLSTPIREGGDWTLQLSDEELISAPNWPEMVERPAPGWTKWPLIVVGPFGNTFAPLLSYIAMRGDTARANSPELQAALQGEMRETSSADRIVAPLERVADWIGQPVFGHDGELGELADLHFEPATRSILSLEVKQKATDDMRAVAFEHVRHRGDTAGHIVVDARRTEERAA